MIQLLVKCGITLIRFPSSCPGTSCPTKFSPTDSASLKTLKRSCLVWSRTSLGYYVVRTMFFGRIRAPPNIVLCAGIQSFADFTFLLQLLLAVNELSLGMCFNGEIIQSFVGMSSYLLQFRCHLASDTLCEVSERTFAP